MESRSFIGRLIRVFTAQQASHVGMFVWLDGGLFVADITSGSNFQIAPASMRLEHFEKNSYLHLGRAPVPVQGCEETVVGVLEYRRTAPRYSFWSLLSVWAAQLLRRRTPHQLVCSTLVEALWSLCGLEFEQTPDPGDYFRLCSGTVYFTMQ